MKAHHLKSLVFAALAACGHSTLAQSDASVSATPDAEVQTFDAATMVDSAPLCTTSQDLVGYWPAEGDGADAVGDHDADLLATGFVPGAHGQAFALDGFDDYVRIADPGDSLYVSGSFSLQAWVRTERAATQTIVQKFECGGLCPQTSASLYQLYLTEVGIPEFWVRTVSTATVEAEGQTSVADGTWHHLVGVRDVTAGVARLYVDGALADEADLGADGADAFVDQDGEADALTIGAGRKAGSATQVHHNLLGEIDEVALHGRALTTAEIQDIYSSGLCLSGS